MRPAAPALLAVLVAAAASGMAAHGEQVFLLTGLGNLFPVEPLHDVRLPEGAVGLVPHLVRYDHPGFFIIGDPRDADALRFHSVYHIPSGAARDGNSVYAMVSGSPHSSTIPNRGPHWYENGRLVLSTNGLDHVLRQALPSRTFSGEPAYWPGSGYLTFHGNGTAAYLLRSVSHNGESVDDFLVEVACPDVPCGSVTAAKSRDRLLIFAGNLTDARLYDTVVLDGTPRVITEEHYLIADTTSGDVRLKAVRYDDSRLEIRNVPRGTAYVITPAGEPFAVSPYGAGGASPWWPAAYAAHGCCYTDHQTLPTIRAGLQTAVGATISYDRDELASSPGALEDVTVRVYPDTAWRQSRLAGGWLLFDHHNEKILRFSGTPERVVLAGAYLKVPSASGTTLSDVGVARYDCTFNPRTLGYLSGGIPPGGSASIPVVPGHPMICMHADGIPAVIRYSEMAEETETIPFRPDSPRLAVPGKPERVPCGPCGHPRLLLESSVGAASHVSTISPRDGHLSLTVTGAASYLMNTTRTWDTTHRTFDASHWSPEVAILDEGGATVAVYRNGVLADSRAVSCQPSSTQRTAHSTTPVASTFVHHWSWNHDYSCTSRVDVRLTIQVAAGDIIDVTVSVSPDIRLDSADRDATGAADAGYEEASVTGILVKSYG